MYDRDRAREALRVAILSAKARESKAVRRMKLRQRIEKWLGTALLIGLAVATIWAADRGMDLAMANVPEKPDSSTATATDDLIGLPSGWRVAGLPRVR